MNCSFPGCEDYNTSRFGRSLYLCGTHWGIAVFILEVISDKIS